MGWLNYFGATLGALTKLGKKRGYYLIYCDNNGVNAFFIKNGILDNRKIKRVDEIYRQPRYGSIVNGSYIGHPPSEKKMIDI